MILKKLYSYEALTTSCSFVSVYHLSQRLHSSCCISFQMGFSPCPCTVTGGTCQQMNKVPSWRRGLFQSLLNVNNRLLLPPCSRYRCSVWINPSFLRSRKARRTVDCDNFKSRAMVGIAGQHSPSLLARSARYAYTVTALCGRSEWYIESSLLVVSTSCIWNRLSCS